MKILVLGDLHSRKDWYSWVIEQISNVDLVALPGDFIDCFGEETDHQKEYVASWFERVVKLGVPIAWCSGNHDMTRWGTIPLDLASACWTDAFRGPSIVGDFETKRFLSKGNRSFLASCLPYGLYRDDPFRNRVEDFLNKASEQRKSLGCPWILLNHEPPSGLLLSCGRSGDLGDEYLRDRVECYQPDLVFSGHVHQAPFHGPFWAEIGQSICFPGCEFKASFPCHIIVDNEKDSAAFCYERNGRRQVEEVFFRNRENR